MPAVRALVVIFNFDSWLLWLSNDCDCWSLVEFTIMDQLHARTTEYINMLIIVMSWLDAVVASIAKCIEAYGKSMMCQIQTDVVILMYGSYLHVNFANKNGNMIQLSTLSCLLEANCTYWLWVTVQSISDLWWTQLKTKAKWLVVQSLCM